MDAWLTHPAPSLIWFFASVFNRIFQLTPFLAERFSQIINQRQKDHQVKPERRSRVEKYFPSWNLDIPFPLPLNSLHIRCSLMSQVFVYNETGTRQDNVGEYLCFPSELGDFPPSQPEASTKPWGEVNLGCLFLISKTVSRDSKEQAWGKQIIKFRP